MFSCARFSVFEQIIQAVGTTGSPRDKVAHDSSDVRSVCEAHLEWERAAEARAVQFIKNLPQVAPSEQGTLPAISIEELRHSQELDPGRSCCSWSRASYHPDEREVGYLLEHGHYVSSGIN